jgi:hypothetical protein
MEMGWALFDFYVYKFVLHRSLIQMLKPFNFDFTIGEILLFQNRLPAVNDAGGLYGYTIFVLAILAKNCAASHDSVYHLLIELATLYIVPTQSPRIAGKGSWRLLELLYYVKMSATRFAAVLVCYLMSEIKRICRLDLTKVISILY